MVVYAVLVQVSVADLFLAGFLPGILMGGALMAMIYWLVRTGRVTAPPTQRMSYPRLGRTFVRALPALAAPILLTVGLLAGVATPTELGALTVVYAAALGFLQRELTVADLIGATRETLVTCGVLCFIIACAVPFGWIVATSQAPMKLAALMMSISDNKYVILMIINVALLIIAASWNDRDPAHRHADAVPLVVALGIDPVHFGIILVVNLLIGTLTPPFGVILFIMMDIAKISLARMTRAVLPFYLPLFLTLMVITYWADFVLAVPRFFGKAN
jgi:tripartite ATP-independent transporter DctM subunit